MIHRNFAWAVRIAVYTLAFAPEALAQTHYYVDSSWPTPGGTGGEFDPFQTIDALNIAVGNIPSGATVHLKRGGVYVGQINVDADATNVNIVADPELSDAPKPVLYGSIEATTWHGPCLLDRTTDRRNCSLCVQRRRAATAGALPEYRLDEERRVHTGPYRTTQHHPAT